MAAGLVAVASALGGAPSSTTSSRSASRTRHRRARARTRTFGMRPVNGRSRGGDPGETASGNLSAASREAWRPGCGRCRGSARIVTPSSNPELRLEEWPRRACCSPSSPPTSTTSPVSGRLSGTASPGDSAVKVGGAAVTVDELTKTTQDDLQRIELFALPLLLLLSLLVFRGFVAALLPVAVGALSILTTLLLLNALTPLVDIDTFAINIVTGLGTRARDRLQPVPRHPLQRGARDKEDDRGDAGGHHSAIGRMIVFSGLTVAVSLVALCIFPQRFLYSIGIGGALVALMSAAVCLLFLPALLALLGSEGERPGAARPAGGPESPAMVRARPVRARPSGQRRPRRSRRSWSSPDCRSCGSS